MKNKQSARTESAGTQLGFELVVLPVEDFSQICVPICETPDLPPQTSIYDVTPLLQRRAAETDRALLKAVQRRAEHLADCLIRQR